MNVNVCRCSSRRNSQSRNPECPPSLHYLTVSANIEALVLVPLAPCFTVHSDP